jgi:probable addiction module antidote protein
MAEKFTPYDPAEDLTSPEDIALFLQEAFATGDAKFVAHCFGIAARAKGMTQLARESGISREHLYIAFSEDGNPTLKTLFPVLRALGVELSARPAAECQPA